LILSLFEDDYILVYIYLIYTNNITLHLTEEQGDERPVLALPQEGCDVLGIRLFLYEVVVAGQEVVQLPEHALHSLRVVDAQLTLTDLILQLSWNEEVCW
jgi:hypothetical protein